MSAQTRASLIPHLNKPYGDSERTDGGSSQFVATVSSLSRGLLQIRHGLLLEWIAQMRSDTLVIDDGDAGVASEKQDKKFWRN